MNALPNGGIGINGGRGNGIVVIGGSTIADRNLISGNGNSGFNGAAGADTDVLKIQGNYFGCNKDCSAALPNGAHNIALNTYTNPVIGGANPGEGNVAVGAGNGGYYGFMCIAAPAHRSRATTSVSRLTMRLCRMVTVFIWRERQM